jgi:hypothetical protein
MLYPSLLTGAIYDDNIFQTSTNRTAALGLRFRPAIVATRQSGVHQTTFYANGDFSIYPGNASAGNALDAQIGFIHRWEVERDLTLSAAGQYALYTDMYTSGEIFSQNGGLATLNGPQRFESFSGSLSGLKSFDHVFVGLAGSISGTTYDTVNTTSGPLSQSYRDAIVPAASARLGYAVSPAIYAYSEASGNVNSVNDANYNSRGYRLVSGLGLNRISLFNGEIFAGYQRQLYDNPQFGSQASPVYGGKLSWNPTPAWSLGAGLDETFQNSGLQTVGNPTGGAARVTTASLSVNYGMAARWSASVRSGYSEVAYINGGQVDHRWSAGASFNYTVFRNFGLTLDYTFVDVISNVRSASLVRNQLTLGTTYKY